MSKETNFVSKAIIPAGGLGSRFLPASAAIPKEIFPVFDRPLISFAIEELKEAGVKDIYLVVSPWKKFFFENFFNLKERFGHLKDDPNKKAVLKKIESMESWPNIHYVIQHEAKGLAEAVGLCKEKVGLEPFFVLLPDEVFVSQGENPSQALLNSFNSTQLSCVGLFEVPLAETKNYGIADLSKELENNAFYLKKLIEKPKPEVAPSQMMLPGRYLFTNAFWAAISSELSELKDLKSGKELHITKALDRMAGDKHLIGKIVTGERFDVGRPEGLLALSHQVAQADSI